LLLLDPAGPADEIAPVRIVIRDIEQVDNLTVIWSSTERRTLEARRCKSRVLVLCEYFAPSERGYLLDSARRTEHAAEAARSSSSSWLAETSRIDAAVAATIADVAAASMRALGYPAALVPQERFASTAAG